MDSAKQYLKDNKIIPFLSFKNKEPHTVKLLNDKIDEIMDSEGEMVAGVTFLVEEGGQQKKFFTRSSSLISILAEYNQGDVVTIQMVATKKGDKWVNSYNVTSVISTTNKERKEEEDKLRSISP